MKNRTIISDNSLVTSYEDMNESLEDYLSEQYLILKQYLTSIDENN